MAEFIRLDEQEQEAPILPDYPHSISNIKPDNKKEDVAQLRAGMNVSVTLNKPQ